jgi:hypothetical protein
LSLQGLKPIGHCPCKGQHKNKSQDNDFALNIAPSPKDNGFRLILGKCYHQSCKSAVYDFMKKLNSQWSKYLGQGELTEINKEELEAKRYNEWQERNRLEDLKLSAICQADTYKRLTNYPTQLPEPIFGEEYTLDFIQSFKLFTPDDIIFIGSKYDSEGYLYKANPDYFVKHSTGANPPNFFSSCTFKDLNGPRQKTNVLNQVYRVLEHDKLPLEYQWTLLLFIDKWITPMKMALTTGNKSIHGWFPRNQQIVNNLKLFDALGFDPAMETSTQPTRMPGLFRNDTDKYQRMIFWKN